jgi:hypothetical protein
MSLRVPFVNPTIKPVAPKSVTTPQATRSMQSGGFLGASKGFLSKPESALEDDKTKVKNLEFRQHLPSSRPVSLRIEPFLTKRRELDVYTCLWRCERVRTHPSLVGGVSDVSPPPALSPPRPSPAPPPLLQAYRGMELGQPKDTYSTWVHHPFEEDDHEHQKFINCAKQGNHHLLSSC